ncbi:TonB-dependent receptor [Mangrovimonas sp. DI 80]|uniref:TonB-dependent receptor n=1 Tax=Mangrovimonas sp. DI 80 TaxID=1779330 RepID=UPI000976D4A4|nr:TonB-dependent receptor [Mangrovimonas sp. DI 80]OMP30945.1 TonB-dependent receptor [Mangrovimonas sp. DI 80]
MKHLFITAITTLLGLLVNGQNCNIIFSGKIVDFHNGEPIIDATVHVESLDIYTTTDLDGKFILKNLCKGPLKVTFSHLSCETKTIEINLTENLERIIYLEHHVEELETIVVKGAEAKKKTTAAQETIIKTDVIDDYSSASLGDVIKQVSGVTSITTGSKIVKPVINGLHSSRVLVVNNNVRMEDQDWGIEHAPNIDVNAADNISVIKGAGTLAYGGDAIGGVVILEPKHPHSVDSLFGKTITGFQSNGLGYNISSSLHKTFESGWYANGVLGYKQNGDLKAPDYYLNNTGSKSFSASLQGGFKSFEKGFEVYLSHIDNEIGILSASHIGNTEDLVNAINNREPLVNEHFSYRIKAPKQDVNHTLVKATGFKRFKSFGKVNFQYDYQNNQRFEYDKRVGSDKNKPAVDLNLQTHSLRVDTKVDNLEGYIMDFGVSGRFQDNFANPDTGVRRLIPDYQKLDFGVYGIIKSYFNDKLSGDLGIRYDYNHIDSKKYYKTSRWEERGYDEDFSDIIIDDLGTQLLTNPKFSFHNISLSTGLLYNLNQKNEVSFNYSLSSRPPNPSELFSDGLHHSAARIELGDLRINKELSNRLGLSYRLNTKRIVMNLETYFNHINDFIYIKPTGTEATIRGTFPVWEYFQTNAILTGIDASFDVLLSNNWNFNNKSSYVYGQDTENDLPVIDMPSFRLSNTLSYSKANWKDLNIALNHEFVAKQNRYPDYNFETYIATSDSYVLVDISTPPAAYNLFNLSADATFDISNKMSLNVMAAVENIFDTSYREYLNRLRYFADDTGRNITVQLKFNY